MFAVRQAGSICLTEVLALNAVPDAAAVTQHDLQLPFRLVIVAAIVIRVRRHLFLFELLVLALLAFLGSLSGIFLDGTLFGKLLPGI
jgi:hypothetical protein